MGHSGWIDRFKHRVAYHLGIDRRTDFHDLADVEPERRKAQANVIQFYSGVPNIGNYLPVLGIREMLEEGTDVWDAHDHEIDWTFVNRNYSWAIIGGAGLLHADFEVFWEQFATHCHIPFVVWGVGACFPDTDDTPGVAPSTARPALEDAALVNLRDDITADHYGLEKAHVSPCPTVVHLENWESKKTSRTSTVLYSSHTELVDEQEQTALYEVIEASPHAFEYTDNIEHRLEGLEAIVDRYAKSSLVVTTRLHGAIIAYVLQTPYIAVPRDDKVRAFHRLYGNGVLAESVEEVKRLLDDPPEIELGPIQLDAVYQFGRRVEECMTADKSQSRMQGPRR
jgi:hypothetical protein